MPQSSKATRSKRFRISIRKDGHARNPSPNLRSSEYGDPVNFLYAVTDETSATAERERFLAEKDIYAEADENSFNRSVRVIAGRLNRLLRKFGAPVLEPAALMNLSLTNPHSVATASLQTMPVMLDIAESGDILIPAARIATLWHPWWGALHLDDDLFDSFIDNWRSNVIGRDLAVDVDHRRGGFGSASLAWVNDMYIDEPKKIFMMQGEPTPLGRDNLGSVFKYASIEYSENYADPENLAGYGPTLLGLAATNNPFVRGNPPMHYVPPKRGLSGSGRSYYIPNKESQMPNQRNDGEQTFQIGERTYTLAQLEAMAAENEALHGTVKSQRIDAARAAALGRGVPPSLVNYVLSIMESVEPSASPALSLTVPTGTDGEADERQFNLFGAMEVLLTLAPGRMEDEGDEGDEGNRQENPRQPIFSGSPYDPQADEGKSADQLEAEAIARRKELGIAPATNGVVPEAAS